MRVARAFGAAVVAAAVAGCGHPAKKPYGEVGDLETRERSERWYRLSWHGSPVGWAVERESKTTIERTEHVEVLRGTVPMVTDIDIQIDVEPDLTPIELRVEKTISGDTTSVRAVRDAEGWRRIARGRKPGPVFAPPDAVPSELVPAMVRVRGAFSAPVILSGWDLALGDGVVIATGDNKLAARTVVADRAIDAAIELDMHGNTERVVDSTGTVESRMDKAGATAAFEPVDVIQAAAILLADTSVPILITLDPRSTPLPPALPGQTVVAEGGAWKVTLDPAIAGSLPLGPVTKESFEATVLEIAAGVHDAIAPSLAGNTASSGDCTAYAVAFAGYARMAGIDSHVVTGFVVDRNQLVRHRWNVAWTGTRWMTVDASQPDLPAPRLGIAMSDDSIAGLTAASMFDLDASRD
jgi:hypothetical protein